MTFAYSRLRLLLASLVFLAGLFTALVSTRAQPRPPSQVWYVDANLGSSANDGSTWTSAFNTATALDDAIAAAAAGDEIWVADGTYVPTGGSGFYVTKQLKFYGGFAGSVAGVGGETNLQARAGLFLTTVLDGTGTTPVASVDSVGTAGVVIDGFKIANGIANSTLSGTTSDGGGIYCHQSDLLLANCLFVNNFAAHDGGGLFFEGASGTPNILNIKLCEFQANHVEHNGGAMFGQFLATRGDIVNVMFDSNYSTYVDGGAVYLWEMGTGHQLWFTNCVFWGNYANTSTSHGGAMNLGESGSTSATAANTMIVNCTFAANYVPTSCTNGQALFISTHSVCNIYNSILYANGQSGCAGVDPISGTPTAIGYSDVEGLTGTIPVHMLSVNPLFRNVASPSGLTLKGGPPASQCLDAADTNRLPDDLLDIDEDGYTTGQTIQIDMNGVGRWYDWSVTDTGNPPGMPYLDMGAYEKKL